MGCQDAMTRALPRRVAACGKLALTTSHVLANLSNMAPTLGQEIRRLRTAAQYTLTRFATELDISAPYLSDIERDRRRPPEKTLRLIADKLKGVGAKYEDLEALVTRIDQDTRAWADATPGVREMLRKVRESGRDPREVLREIEETEKNKDKKKR